MPVIGSLIQADVANPLQNVSQLMGIEGELDMHISMHGALTQLNGKGLTGTQFRTIGRKLGGVRQN